MKYVDLPPLLGVFWWEEKFPLPLTGVPVEGLIGREAELSPFSNKVEQISLALLLFI